MSATLPPDMLAEYARESFKAADQSRQEIEERKVEAIRAYRAFREQLQDGGRAPVPNEWGGYSRLGAPIVFWIIETMLPRLGTNPPSVIVTAKSPEAVAYQQAKRLRLEHHLKLARMDRELTLSIKQFLILGDGPQKHGWDAALGGPNVWAISWFNFFVSPDAERWDKAECLYHRTWHTPADIVALSRQQDENGHPLYDPDALERALAHASGNRDQTDRSWDRLRQVSGLGPVTWPEGRGQVPLVECWWRDGTMAVIDGWGDGLVFRYEQEPIYRDPDGNPYRPFSVLSNTPDPFMPYAIGDAEMIADHQREAEVLRRQRLDQTTLNLNAPVAYDRGAGVTHAEVIAAFGRPGGLLGVNGRPGDVIQRFAPGQSGTDFGEMFGNLVDDAQRVSGINDTIAGLNDPGSETATQYATRNAEANKRLQQKLKWLEVGMLPLAQQFDWMDRQFGGKALAVNVGQDFRMEDGAKGIVPAPNAPGWFTVDGGANDRSLLYDVELDVGSMSPPGQSEQVREMQTFLQGVLGMPPQAQMLFNWQELARRYTEAFGLPPEQILVPAQGMQVPGAPVPPGAPGAPPPQPAGGAPQEVPVGPPQPVG